MLICWEHKNLVGQGDEMVNRLKERGSEVEDAPAKWIRPGGDVYGVTWVFGRAPGEKTCVYKEFEQRLVYDDSKRHKK
ncbi:MAG: hypothetical protein ACRC33_28765 [Gemmataceae bacterium]